MKKRIISSYDAGKRCKDVLDNYSDEVNSEADIKEEKVLLEEKLVQMEEAATIQQNDSTGETEAKKNAKTVMADTVIKYALRATVKAKKIKNIELANDLNHKQTYILSGSDAVGLAKAKDIKDKIKKNLGILGITTDQVTEMEKAIEIFENIMSLPQVVIGTKKVKGTEKLNELQIELTDTLDNLSNLIDSYFPKSGLSKEFANARKLHENGTRHNHLILQVEDSETKKVIADAKATIQKDSKTETADDEGQVIFNTIPAGKQKITVEAPGYISKTINVYVEQSTTTELVVELEKE